jgi:cytochrome b6-f complex iron-sulfur subunit
VRGEIDRAAADTAYQHGYEHAVKGVYHVPLVPSDRGRWIDTSHKAAGVTPGQAVRFRTGAVEGFLVNPGEGQPIYALSAACTHMGCMITWLDGAGTFLCPCHGAQYDADGSVLNGVARRPLPHLWVRQEKDGSLYVWAVGEHPTVSTLAPYNSD